MILYHFTTRDAVDSILEHGIRPGEAPLGPTRVVRAANLTTDSDPHGHGLDRGGHVVDAAEAAFYASKGMLIPVGTVFADKTAARITVRLASSDRLLKQWRPWARRHCETGYDKVLEAAAGPSSKPRTWCLYFATVPPEMIREAVILKP